MDVINITQPAAEPVTLAQVYKHLRLDPEGSPPTHPDDTMLNAQITAARDWAEKFTRRSFVEQRLRLLRNGIPTCRTVDLLRPPVRSIQRVIYYDADNVAQVVSTGDYVLVESRVPQLRFLDTFSIPTTYDRDDSLQIEYTAGYEPTGSPAEDYAANVPQPIKQGILLGVELLYDFVSPEQRERLERAREALLGIYRIPLAV